MNRRIRRIRTDIAKAPKIDHGYYWSSTFMCAQSVVVSSKAYRYARLAWLKEEHERRAEAFRKSEKAWEVSMKLDVNF